MNDSPIRSALYLPGSSSRAIAKAPTLVADAVIFDLEDAVAPDAKPDARRSVEDAFSRCSVGVGINVIRINGLETEYFSSDLSTVGKCRPDAVLVPKVSKPEDIMAVRRAIDLLPTAGYRPALWCMIETAQGVLQVPKIAAAQIDSLNAIDCLVIGTNDIARETAVSTSGGRQFLLPWLMSAVLAAKANGIAILDGVWNDFKNLQGFDDEAVQGKSMGFDGKTLIHPCQVDSANRVFSPSAEDLEDARKIVSAFAALENAGQGVININGRMVERLHLLMAVRLIRKHEAIKARKDCLDVLSVDPEVSRSNA